MTTQTPHVRHRAIRPLASLVFLVLAATMASAQTWYLPGLGIGASPPAPAGAGLAVGDLDLDGLPDLILMANDDRPGPDLIGYRVGRRMRVDNGRPFWEAPSWTGTPVWAPWSLGDESRGAGVALAHLGGGSAVDIVLTALVRTNGGCEFRWIVGRDLDGDGVPQGGWILGTPIPAPTVDADGAGVTAGDVDGDGREDLVFASYEVDGTNSAHHYCVALGVDVAGTFRATTRFHTIPGNGPAQGADVHLAQLDNDPRPDLVLADYANTFRYLIAWNLDHLGEALIVTRAPDLMGLGSQSEGLGVAILDIDHMPRLDVIVMTYDIGFGPNAPNQFRVRLEKDAIGVDRTITEARGAGFERVASTVSPAPRRHAALAYDARRGRVVLHGGEDDRGTVLSDTWEWDGVRWREILWAQGPAMARHAMVFDPSSNRLVACGLTSGGVQTRAYDGTTWSPPLTMGWTPRLRPGERLEHASLTFHETLPGVVCAARTDGPSQVPLNGWTNGALAGGDPPFVARYLPWNGRLVGFAFSEGDDTVRTWNGSAQGWSWTDPETLDGLRGANAFDVVVDTARNRVVCIATDRNLRILEWDGVTRIGPRGSVRESYVAFDETGGDLVDGFACAYDEARDQVLLFGGERRDGTLSNELLRLWTDLPHFDTFGRGCAGHYGVPRLSSASGPPIVGQALVLQLDDVPPDPRTPFLFLGLSRESWGNVILPFDLAWAGMPGCTLHVSWDDTLVMQRLGNIATWGLYLPALPGATVYLQAGLFDAHANAAQLVTSNAVRVVIGQR